MGIGNNQSIKRFTRFNVTLVYPAGLCLIRFDISLDILDLETYFPSQLAYYMVTTVQIPIINILFLSYVSYVTLFFRLPSEPLIISRVLIGGL